MEEPDRVEKEGWENTGERKREGERYVRGQIWRFHQEVRQSCWYKKIKRPQYNSRHQQRIPLKTALKHRFLPLEMQLTLKNGINPHIPQQKPKITIIKIYKLLTRLPNLPHPARHPPIPKQKTNIRTKHITKPTIRTTEINKIKKTIIENKIIITTE